MQRTTTRLFISPPRRSHRPRPACRRGELTRVDEGIGRKRRIAERLGARGHRSHHRKGPRPAHQGAGRGLTGRPSGGRGDPPGSRNSLDRMAGSHTVAFCRGRRVELRLAAPCDDGKPRSAYNRRKEGSRVSFNQWLIASSRALALASDVATAPAGDDRRRSPDFRARLDVRAVGSRPNPAYSLISKSPGQLARGFVPIVLSGSINNRR